VRSPPQMLSRDPLPALSTNGEDGIVGRSIVALIVVDDLTGNAGDQEGLSATVTRGVSELQVDLLHDVCRLWGASPGRVLSGVPPHGQVPVARRVNTAGTLLARSAHS
jgi:hypothetical protein